MLLMTTQLSLSNAFRFKMLTLLSALFIGLIGVLLSLSTFADSSATDSQSPPILIDSQWLQNTVKKHPKAVVLIDLRTPKTYQAGHIPGAINIPFAKFNRAINQVEGFLLTPLNFQELMEKKGIQLDDHLVLYSDKTVLDSTRIYWSFDFYGHKKLSVLDGGLRAWRKQGGKTQTEIITLPTSTYQVEIHPDKFSSKFKTLMATKQKDTYIIDARPAEQYQGQESKTDQFGHIPTASNFPWQQLVESSDKPPTKESYFRYLPLKKLQEQLKTIPQDKQVILYCNGGKESSVIYFGLKLLGREAALYDGSWFEWSSDKSLPITAPDKPGSK